jgi:hypothetical protein
MFLEGAAYLSIMLSNIVNELRSALVGELKLVA